MVVVGLVVAVAVAVAVVAVVAVVVVAVAAAATVAVVAAAVMCERTLQNARSAVVMLSSHFALCAIGALQLNFG